MLFAEIHRRLLVFQLVLDIGASDFDGTWFVGFRTARGIYEALTCGFWVVQVVSDCWVPSELTVDRIAFLASDCAEGTLLVEPQVPAAASSVDLDRVGSSEKSSKTQIPIPTHLFLSLSSQDLGLVSVYNHKIRKEL
uniref:Uncharacterized protein n=1 Tax=Ananas comosus var. bracteatus TaxID=296719 RepID=A0A6V7Q258_ANACO|nr:unnamed protein product [Ananas comosus var. bracteatus]